MNFRILRMITTSGFLTALEFTKFVFGRSSAADPCVLAVVCLSVILLSLDADAQPTVMKAHSVTRRKLLAYSWSLTGSPTRAAILGLLTYWIYDCYDRFIPKAPHLHLIADYS